MTQINFQREMLINAPIAHVWQFVATESGLRQWWGNTISLEAKEGGRCEEWQTSRDRATHWQGVVTIYRPPHQLMLTLRAQERHHDAPELTTISIALETQGEQTRVHVTQRAFGLDTAIGKGTQPGSTTQPDKSYIVPLAQLQHPAPGSIPMPAVSHMPATRRIDPTLTPLTRQQTETLTHTWQLRLTSLATAATHKH